MTTRGLASTTRPRSSRVRANGARSARGPSPKRQRTAGSITHAYGVPVPAELHEAIEIERGNLSKAESLLGCLAISMEYETDAVTGPYYPDVAQLARDLVRQSINALDSLVLQQHLLRNKIKEESGLPGLDRECCLTERDGTMYQSAMAGLSMLVTPLIDPVRNTYA